MPFAVVFPGQGSQSVGMGLALQDTKLRARTYLKQCDALTSLNPSLLETLLHGPEEILNQPFYTALGIVSVSLATLAVCSDLLKHPECIGVAGHSLGEYTALCATGVLSLEETLTLVQARVKAMEQAVPEGQGGMMAILGVSQDVIQKTMALVPGFIEIANDNGGDQWVLSGEKSALEIMKQKLSEAGAKRIISLNVRGPFHSSWMKPAQPLLAQALDPLVFRTPCVPIVSNVSAQPESDPSTLKANLINHLCQGVRWRETMDFFASQGVTHVLEMGPGSVLSGLFRRSHPSISCLSFSQLSSFQQLTELLGHFD